ncbi:Regulatory protein Spx [Lacunisphaera limnophila]|uniref:Regulatory protein Spx n=1 Tax=Lacunisphaera limnophila TaxID=1838286 RepID=A0A1D8AS20_9BACT|nr:ArsC/Spx/MgsR family protein [Lacunisphaera limnophila]AOS43695.1 Regulatory protein Spx [Lacunisphaera limnophila]
MSALTFYAHPKCSTCQKARDWLQRHGLAVIEKDIRTTPPSLAELRVMLQGQGGELRRLGNSSGIEYRALGLSAKLATMPEADFLRQLAGNGMLVKRPFLLGAGVALVGFREPAWAAALLKP